MITPPTAEPTREADVRRGSSRQVEAALVAPPRGPQESRSAPPTVLPWGQLDRRAYRAGLRRGVLRLGIALEEPLVRGRPTLLFICGGRGAPGQFAELARGFRGRASLGAFLYDDRARLAPSAELLREGLLFLRDPVVIVAHSIGALLAAHVGATDPDGRLPEVAALYLNPLIGGSRHADADPALAVLGDVRGLRWLHGVKRAIQRTFFPSVVQDLTPESDFQQSIFGTKSRPSSFAASTVLLFTERPGEGFDIREDRVRGLFGRPRQELVARMGTAVPVRSEERTGHAAPLDHLRFVLPLLATALDAVQAHAPDRGWIAALASFGE